MKWSGDQALLGTLRALQKQAPYAASLAVNNILFAGRKEVQDNLPNWLNMTRGTKFITSSVVVNKASKTILTGTVGFLPRVPLIHLMEEGGRRMPLKKSIPLRDAKDFPKAPPRSKSPGKMLARKDVFSGTIKGVSGIWQRKRAKKLNTVNLLYSWRKQTTYDGGDMHFHGSIQKVLTDQWAGEISKALERAMSTAKR